MPSPNKKEAVKKIDVSTPKTQMQSLIGVINYYRDMLKYISGILTALSSMTSKQAKWNWSKECLKACDIIKNIDSGETLLSYPTSANLLLSMPIQANYN